MRRSHGRCCRSAPRRRRPTATPAILSTVRLTGGATRPLRRRRGIAEPRRRPEQRRRSATITIQLAAGVRIPLAKSLMTLLLIGQRAAVAEDQQHHALPAEQPGQRHHERRQPEPGDDRALEHADRPRRRAARRGRRPPRPAGRSFTSSAVIDAADARRRSPIDRSISPSSRTNTSPIASSMNTAPCIEQVHEVAGGEEVRVQDWKMIEIRNRPSDDRQHAAVAGADARTDARKYSPSVVRPRARRPRPARRRAADVGCSSTDVVGRRPGVRRRRPSSALRRRPVPSGVGRSDVPVVM